MLLAVSQEIGLFVLSSAAREAAEEILPSDLTIVGIIDHWDPDSQKKEDRNCGNMKGLGRMVCTQRVAGLGHMNLRILENNKGKKLVAVDPVGAREGNWVFTSGSAARFACPNPEVQTDLTIGGIIDYWGMINYSIENFIFVNLLNV